MNRRNIEVLLSHIESKLDKNINDSLLDDPVIYKGIDTLVENIVDFFDDMFIYMLYNQEYLNKIYYYFGITSHYSYTCSRIKWKL